MVKSLPLFAFSLTLIRISLLKLLIEINCSSFIELKQSIVRCLIAIKAQTFFLLSILLIKIEWKIDKPLSLTITPRIRLTIFTFSFPFKDNNAHKEHHVIRNLKRTHIKENLSDIFNGNQE